MGFRNRGHRGKPDANTGGIVEALRACHGVTVVHIGKPLDLIVGCEGRNYLVEIKNPDGKDRRGPSWVQQQAFMRNWLGQSCVCDTAVEVLNAIGYLDHETEKGKD